MAQLSTPLLSIIIPTRNRARYAASAIKSILSIESQEFELVVQDNSDSNELVRLVGEHAPDPRLRYFYSPDVLSSGENFNRAFAEARGEYLLCIGDDDIVNPKIVDICHWAESHALDALSDNFRVMFYWPDFTPNGETTRSGRLSIMNFTGKAELLDPEVQLRRCVSSGGVAIQRLPKVYLGIVRRSCLVETLQRIQPYQAGTCPDMYLSVAVASSVRRYCVLDYPVIVPGFSAAGAGMLIATRRHQGRLEDAPHLRAWPNYRWPDLVPRFYSVHTFYAESAWAGLQATNRTDLIDRFNLPFLYLLSSVLYPEYRPAVRASLSLARQTLMRGYPQFLGWYARRLAEALASLAIKRIEARSLYPGRARLVSEIDGIRDTAHAARLLDEYLNRAGQQFDGGRTQIVNG